MVAKHSVCSIRGCSAHTNAAAQTCASLIERPFNYNILALHVVSAASFLASIKLSH